MDDHGVNVTDVTGTAEVLGRPTPAAGWLRSLAQSRARYLVAAMTVYFAVVGGLLVYSDFLPYVTDNNESFSMYFHARNILQFGVRSTAGLTDEANSNAPAAHPYVYTHGGNFPRIPVLALMLLGVTSVEQQITILALLIGGVSLYLCYRFFSRMAGDLFAFLVVAVFSTDYLLFTQWQVNTFRVWHGFFFFASLLCVQALTDHNKRSIGALLLLNAIGLFYFEIVFGFFVALFSVLYAAIVHRRRPILAGWAAGTIALGGIIALSVLLGQSLIHLGSDRALQDIRLTFLARNFDTSNGGAAATTRLQFFMKNHIVYWDSAFQPIGFLAIESLRTALSEGIVRVFTPFLMVVMLIVTLPSLLNAWVSRPSRRFVLVILLVTGTYALLRWALHDPAQITAWQGNIARQLTTMAWQLVLVGTLVSGFLLLVAGEHRALARVRQDISPIARYLLTGTGALAIVNAMFPGYVWNGYLSRYAPLAVFTADVWLALTLYVVFIFASRLRHGQHRPLNIRVLSAISALLFVSIIGYWVSLQTAYFVRLPSTSILFIRQLSRPEFRRASFVSDNYALPISYFTGQWAYQDQLLLENVIVTTSNGPRLRISGKYMWFADRDSNGSYVHPVYYLCRVQVDLNAASRLASLPPGGRLEGCSSQAIVRAAGLSLGELEHVLVASDPTPSDMWALVKLDPRIPLQPNDLPNVGPEPTP